MKAGGVVFLFSLMSCLSTGLGRAIKPGVDCPNDELPVCAKCGEEMRTFSNSCMLRWENENSGTSCYITHHGDCSENIVDCDENCTVFPDTTFCAKYRDSFMTFRNVCQLEKQNRCAKQNYVMIHYGYCK